MQEAAEIAGKLGLRLRLSIEQRIDGAAEVGDHKTSMLQDVEAGKPVEIDVLLSAVHEIGALVGEATPQLGALLGLARLHARTYGLYAE